MNTEMGRRGRSGQVLLEFALLAPLYVFFLVALLWFDRFGSARFDAEIAARRAARHAPAWRAGRGSAEAAALRRGPDVREAEAGCRPYAGPGGAVAKGGLERSFLSSFLRTREGYARFDFNILQGTHPRGKAAGSRARFVVDPPVGAGGWLRRIRALLGLRGEPRIPYAE